MDTAQWPQEINNVVKPKPKPIEEIGIAGSSEKKKAIRPEKEEAINCPRCDSINTKFCYYNNYSLTQPRFFCKTCRRYWTQGGSLRNIPVGGGSRKNKRPNSNSMSMSNSSSSPNNSTTTTTKIAPPNNIISIHQGQDLNLAFPDQLVQQNNNNSSASACSSTSTTTTTPSSTCHLSALELLTAGISTSTTSNSMGLHSFMPVQLQPADHTNSINYGIFPVQDFKPTLNFSLDHGHGNIITGFAGLHHQETTSTINGRVLFPFEDLKQVSTNNSTIMEEDHNNKEDQQAGYSSAGYWTGMLGDGGGGSW